MFMLYEFTKAHGMVKFLNAVASMLAQQNCPFGFDNVRVHVSPAGTFYILIHLEESCDSSLAQQIQELYDNLNQNER